MSKYEMIEAKSIAKIERGSKLTGFDAELLATSSNPECLGALYYTLDQATNEERALLGFSGERYFFFLLSFHKLCIKESPDGNWSNSRYLSAHELSCLYLDALQSRKGTEDHLTVIKLQLEELLHTGNEDVRDCILTGFLENVLKYPKARQKFRDWWSDDQLSLLYEEALSLAS